MTAKEIQTEFIKGYLKPTLKEHGYKTSGQTWWKDKGDFFTLINLQNFSWNSKDSVDFCFNIGVVLKVTMKDADKQKPSVHNLTVYLRENSYLSQKRQEHKYRNKTGYTLNEQAELNDFIAEMKSDFDHHILPSLDQLNSLENCLERFGEIEFWGDNLKRVVAENKLLKH